MGIATKLLVHVSIPRKQPFTIVVVDLQLIRITFQDDNFPFCGYGERQMIRVSNAK